jgi:hypothetical protein
MYAFLFNELCFFFLVALLEAELRASYYHLKALCQPQLEYCFFFFCFGGTGV